MELYTYANQRAAMALTRALPDVGFDQISRDFFTFVRAYARVRLYRDMRLLISMTDAENQAKNDARLELEAISEKLKVTPMYNTSERGSVYFRINSTAEEYYLDV